MKAVVYKGPFDVRVEEVEDPRIDEPLDAPDMDEGLVFGHENMGIVEEVGSAVGRIKVGNRVSVPFNLACGTCRSCNAGFIRQAVGPEKRRFNLGWAI